MVVSDTKYVMVFRFFKILFFAVLCGSVPINGTVFAGSAGTGFAFHAGADFGAGVVTDPVSGEGMDRPLSDEAGFGGDMMPVQPCGEVDPDAYLDPDSIPDCGDSGLDELSTTTLSGIGNSSCLVFLLVPFALALAVIIFRRYR